MRFEMAMDHFQERFYCMMDYSAKVRIVPEKMIAELHPINGLSRSTPAVLS